MILSGTRERRRGMTLPGSFGAYTGRVSLSCRGERLTLFALLPVGVGQKPKEREKRRHLLLSPGLAMERQLRITDAESL